ncbi:MAG TPA: transcriptional regulator [Gammaproteobacteria bacterium]|nr:transcriptional regulator [Gammaproteobacteria bacterium]
MLPAEFFEKNPVFTHEEFKRYAISQGSLNENTQKEILAYHLRKKNIVRIRRGLFVSIPLSFRDTAESYVIDPYLIAGRINDDAVLAYHSAFDFHGVSYTLSQQMIFLSQHKIQPFIYQQTEFTRLPFPKALIKKKKINAEVMSVDREGLTIKVTSLERTIVDALDRPEYAGGFEEIWRSAAHIPVLNFNKMIEYAILLDNATTIAKLGFFLEQYQKKFNVDEKSLNKLQAKKPASVHYLERSKREAGKFISRWNLMVPRRIIEREWEEPTNDSV